MLIPHIVGKDFFPGSIAGTGVNHYDLKLVFSTTRVEANPQQAYDVPGLS